VDSSIDITQHIDRLGVSLDGNEEDTDRARGSGTWKRAYDFLEHCIGHTETVIMATIPKNEQKRIPYLESLQDSMGATHLQVTLL
jgi:MoaA/NifB/PqqE/SkfB family radical SAM enzyme